VNAGKGIGVTVAVRVGVGTTVAVWVGVGTTVAVWVGVGATVSVGRMTAVAVTGEMVNVGTDV